MNKSPLYQFAYNLGKEVGLTIKTIQSHPTGFFFCLFIGYILTTLK